MSENAQFDFKKAWLDLAPAERETFAEDAGTTSHYIRTHLIGRRKIPGKRLMDGLFRACRVRHWVRTKSEIATFFYR